MLHFFYKIFVCRIDISVLVVGGGYSIGFCCGFWGSLPYSVVFWKSLSFGDPQQSYVTLCAAGVLQLGMLFCSQLRFKFLIILVVRGGYVVCSFHILDKEIGDSKRVSAPIWASNTGITVSERLSYPMGFSAVRFFIFHSTEPTFLSFRILWKPYKKTTTKRLVSKILKRFLVH